MLFDFPVRGLFEVVVDEVAKVGRGAILATMPPPPLLPPPMIELKLRTELDALIPARIVLPIGFAPPRVGVGVSEEALRSLSEPDRRDSFRDVLDSDLDSDLFDSD